MDAVEEGLRDAVEEGLRDAVEEGLREKAGEMGGATRCEPVVPLAIDIINMPASFESLCE